MPGGHYVRSHETARLVDGGSIHGGRRGGVGAITVADWAPGTVGHGWHQLCCCFSCRRLRRGFARSAAALGALPRCARRPTRLRTALLALWPVHRFRGCVLARLLTDLSCRGRAGRVCSHPPELTLRSSLSLPSVARVRHRSFCDSGCRLAAQDVLNRQELRCGSLRMRCAELR
jgi:hypothetical protein